MKVFFALVVLLALAACTGEVPPPSCKGDNLRPINSLSTTQSSAVQASFGDCGQQAEVMR